MTRLLAAALIILVVIAGAFLFAVSVGPSGRGGCTDNPTVTGPASCYDWRNHLHDAQPRND